MIWVWLALLSAVFFAFNELYSKLLFKKKIEPSQVIISQTLFIVVATFFFAKPFEFVGVFESMWYLFLLKAIFGLFSTAMYLHLLEKYEISSVSPLNNLSPAVLLVFSFFFLDETLSWINIVGIFVLIYSTIFLELGINFPHNYKKNGKHGSLLNLSHVNLKLVFKVALMLIALSFCAIFDKMILSSGANVYVDLYFSYILIFIGLIGYHMYKSNLTNVVKSVAKHPGLLLQSALFFLSLVLVLAAIAAPGSLVSVVIPLRRTSTLITAFVGGFLFHELGLKRKVCAVCIMLVGVLLVVF